MKATVTVVLLTLGMASSGCACFPPWGDDKEAESTTANCEQTQLLNESGVMNDASGKVLLLSREGALYPVEVASDEILESYPPQVTIKRLSDGQEQTTAVSRLELMCTSRLGELKAEVLSSGQWQAVTVDDVTPAVAKAMVSGKGVGDKKEIALKDLRFHKQESGDEQSQ